MSSRERDQLDRIKVSLIRYMRANQCAVFGKNEAVKILLRKAQWRNMKYSGDS
jgi:hypothetical protein